MLRRFGLRLSLAAALAIGLGAVAWAQGSARYDGQYMGELTLAKTVGGDCTEPPLGSLYPLTVSRGEVRFSYVPRFGTTLSGTVDDKGNLRASVQLKSGTIQMTGRIQGSQLTASIASPSCNYRFQTKN